MQNDTVLPQEISAYIKSESKDFIVKSSRNQPLKNGFSYLFFAFLWLTITSIVGGAFALPLFFGQDVHFTVNGNAQVATASNFESLYTPIIIITLFLIIGIGVFFYALRILFGKGPFFVGTPTRLVSFDGKSIKSIDWEQFSGNIEMRGNDVKGSISLEMRAGRIIQGKNSEQYVPDLVYMIGIPNVFKIEEICRKRIKENDPTPSTIFEDMAQVAHGMSNKTNM